MEKMWPAVPKPVRRLRKRRLDFGLDFGLAVTGVEPHVEIAINLEMIHTGYALNRLDEPFRLGGRGRPYLKQIWGCFAFLDD